MSKKGKSIKWTKEELQILTENYEKYLPDDIYKLIPGHTRMAIMRKACYLGLHTNQSDVRKIYTIDHDYFNEPNINNCYWAGFIAADGYISKDRSVLISLSIKDKIILEKFSKEISYNGPLKISTLKDKKYVKLSVWGVPKWLNSLEKHWNITKRKTDTLIPPNLVELQHKLAFIIGYIDGDGCIRRDKNNKLYFSICGTQKMMEWISDILYPLEDSKYKKYTIFQNGNSKTNKQIRSGTNRAKALLFLLDQVPVKYKLERKWKNIYE